MTDDEPMAGLPFSMNQADGQATVYWESYPNHVFLIEAHGVGYISKLTCKELIEGKLSNEE